MNNTEVSARLPLYLIVNTLQRRRRDIILQNHIKIFYITLEALFLHIKQVDDNGNYYDDGYGNTNKKNDDNYENVDDFVIFCIRKS